MDVFIRSSLYNFYSSHSKSKRCPPPAFWQEYNNKKSVLEAEQYLSIKLDVPIKGVASILKHEDNYRKCIWNFEIAQRSGFELNCRLPSIRSNCHFFDTYGHHRFIQVLFPNFTRKETHRAESRKKEAYEKGYFEKGIVFGCREFRFLCGEIEGKYIKTWFFAVKSLSGDIEEIPIHRVIHEFGDFHEMAAAKKNTRILLGFSGSCRLESSICEDQLEVVPDVIAVDSGNVMTDGCGLISDTLAWRIPYAVTAGLPVRLQRTADDGLPAVIQVRLSCSKGLFKGCLIVTKDRSICPADFIVMRDSMKKTDGPSINRMDCHQYLRIVKTFETALPLHRARGFRGEPGTVRPRQISRDVCMLLCALGVPEEVFIEQAKEEVNEIMAAPITREAAINLAKRMERIEMCRAHSIRVAQLEGSDRNNHIEDNEEVENESLMLADDSTTIESECAAREFVESIGGGVDMIPNVGKDTERMGTSSAVVKNRELEHRMSMLCNKMLCDAQKAHIFLKMGHELNEPRLAQLLQNLQNENLRTLQSGKLHAMNCTYLVGVPDPFNVLQPEEVYISLPCDGMTMQEKKVHNCNHIRGPVVVTRYPCHHPGDVRKLQAIQHPQLSDMLLPTNGGVIIFSTQGSRSQADMMSGGDFDGDAFLIFFGNTSFVDHVIPIEPFNESLLQQGKCDTSKDELHPWRKSRVDDVLFPLSAPEDDPPLLTPTLSQQLQNTMSPVDMSKPVTRSYLSGIDTSYISSIAEDLHTATEDKGEKHDPVDESREMFGALLHASNCNLLGLYCNAWVIHADLDPLSFKALQCDRYARDAMDAAKKGKFVPYIPELLDVSAVPHYLANARWAASKNIYHSQSLAGKLHDAIENTRARHIGTKSESYSATIVNTHEGAPIDEDILHYGTDTYIDVNTARIGTEEEQQLSIRKGGNRDIEDFLKWKGYIADYKSKIKNIIDMKHISKELRDEKTEELQNQYIRLFDDYAIKHAKELENHSNYNYALCESRRRLASIVYVATYKSAKCTNGHYPLTFCWEICPWELHHNKLEKIKEREQRSPFSPLI